MTRSPRERRTLVWAEAVAWTLTRRQSMPAQRLMVLFIDAAISDGLLQVAELAAETLVGWNHRHAIAEFDSVAEAFRDAEFSKFVSSVRRHHSFEEAEQLVERRPAEDRLVIDPRDPLGPQLESWVRDLPKSL